MTGPREASRAAYLDHVISGKAQSQRMRILELMERHQLPRNQREISLMTGFPINVVTARVNALVGNGDLVEEHSCIDPITGHRVAYVELPYRVIPAAEAIQERLF